MKKTLILTLLLVFNTIIVVFSQEPSTNQVVTNGKTNTFDPQFVINKEKIGFWTVGLDYSKSYKIDTTKIKVNKSVSGFVTKINDSIFASVSLVDKNTYITYDCGLTWRKYFMKPTQTYTSYFFLTEKIIYFVNNDGMVIKSINGGLDWDSSSVFNQKIHTDYTKIYFKDKNNGVLFVKYTKCDHTQKSSIVYSIYYTNDGGKNWKFSNIDQYNNLNIWKIHFDKGIGYILTLDGRIFTSTNNGISWYYQKTIDFNNIKYINYDKGIVVNKTSYFPFEFYRIY